MDFQELLGYIAAACTTIAFIPQAWKTYQSKSAKDLSLPMFVLLTTGVFLWLVYGWLISSWPIVGANGVTFLLAASILFHKVKYG